MNRLAPLPVMAAALLAACAPTTSPEPPPAGTLQGYGEARFTHLAALDGGRIAEVLVEEGQTVAAGAVVFRLEPERLALAAEGATAEAAAASARAARAGALDAAVAEAAARLDVARSTWERSRLLFDKGIVARARLDADTATLKAAEASLARARAERDAATTQSAAPSANAALAARRVADLAVTAPVAGRIERVYRRPGEVVAPGEPLAALLGPGAMRVRFFAPQDRLSALAPGTRVALACDGCAAGLTGSVSFVANEPQFTPPVVYSREERAKLVYLVEAIPDAEGAILPGQPVEVRPLP